jgi:glycerophosphoryl diester phosphodiesterase
VHPYLQNPGPLAFAHRGGALGGPENSLPAFAHAVALGYRYLETDVHATADGYLLAFHDARLDRVTDGHGAVAELPWRTVSRARLGGKEPIPLLEDLLDAFPEARFNIDVKAAPASRPLVETIRRLDAWDRVCVGSFSDARLRAVRRLAGPRMATSLGPTGVLALRLGLPTPRQAVCAQVPFADAALLRSARARGIQLHVWTVNERARMNQLLDLGVDGIMTDRTDVLRDVLLERGAWT